MKVTVKLFATFQQVAGVRQTTVSAHDVRNLIRELTSRHEGLKGRFFEDLEGKELRGGINIVVNGRNIRFLDGLATSLKGGDIVAIFPPVAGGLKRRADLPSRLSHPILNSRSVGAWM